MRPGCFPVAISFNDQEEETQRYVEDIFVPNGCQLWVSSCLTNSSN